MKKKLLSLALALALCLGLTVPALAANPVTLTNDDPNSPFSKDGCAVILSDVLSETDVQDQDEGTHHVYQLSADASITIKTSLPEDLPQGWSTGSSPYCYVALLSSIDSADNVIPMFEFSEDNNYSYTFTREDLLEINPDFNLVWVYFDYAGIETFVIPGYVTFGGEGGAPSTETPSKPAFTDVADNSPFKDAIAWAVEQNITKGTSATTFGPGSLCTHNHILTFLWRANGSPAAEGASDFEKAIAWAKSKGLAETIDGGAACTRAQTMMYLWKLAGSPKTEASSTFTDVAADADYAQAVAWAVEQGVTKGTSATTFGPDNTCTRGQIVTFLYRNLAK